MHLKGIKKDPSSTQPSYTVKANSKICIKDVDSGEVFRFCLVPPEDHDARNGKISILTNLGAALICKSVGNMITWQAPSGLRRFEVRSVFRSERI
jgi:transcription elongation GreA/GreB family factor